MMKYPSLDAKRDWYLGSNPNGDSRITRKSMISDGKICGNATDGYYWCGDNGQIRLHIAPYVGKDDSKCICDQGKCLSRGYMETSADWRNYEISGEWRGRGEGNSLTLYGRGEYHYSKSSSADCNSCKGSSVKVNIDLDPAKMRYAFETWHVNYNHTTYTNIPSSVLGAFSNNNLWNQWFRFIHCVYNIENNSKVVCETYIAKGLTNEFVLIKKIVVKGSVQWASGYDGAKACGCPSDDTPILWGGPIVSYRWDDMEDDDAVKWRKLSVREININGTFGDNTTTNPPPPSTSGTLSMKWKDLFNIGVRTQGDSCSGAVQGTQPFVNIYGLTTSDIERELKDDISANNRVRITQKVKDVASILFSRKPRKVETELAKVGSPGGNVRCCIWDQAFNEVVELGVVAANSLSTNYSTTQTFYNENAPNSLPNGLRDEWHIGFEYLGTSANDYVKVRLDDDNSIDGANSWYASWERTSATDSTKKEVEFSVRDLRMIVYI